MLRNMVAIALAAGLMWSCGGEGLVKSPVTGSGDRVGRPLGKLAAQQGASQAVAVITVSQDGEPVSGAAVEFSRSIAGRVPDYSEFVTLSLTDENGQTEVAFTADTVTGY